MECMKPFFLLHTVAAAVVAGGMQILLDDLADAGVLHLNFIAESQCFAGSFAPQILFRQIPFKNRERAFWPERQDDIERYVIGITIKHPIGKDPEIIGGKVSPGLLIASRRGVPRLRPANRRPLAHVIRMRLDGIAAIVDFAVKRRVHARDVVALKIIVNVGLPVALHLVGAPVGKFHSAEIELFGLAGQFSQGLVQRRRFSIQIDEDEIETFLEANRNQTKFRRVEILHPVKFRSHEQRAVKAGGPAMVAAAKEFPAAATGSWITGAMPAASGKAAKDAIVAPGDKERLAEEVEGKVVSCSRGLVDMARNLPCCRKKALLFFFEGLWTEIQRRRQRRGVCDVEIYMNVWHARYLILAQSGLSAEIVKITRKLKTSAKKASQIVLHRVFQHRTGCLAGWCRSGRLAKFVNLA